jgi:hypothetical protein
VTACGARGTSAACGGFGPARNTAATFDAFYWLQVTNYGVLYVLFNSAPGGSNYIDVWDVCLHAQTPPIISWQMFLATPPGESKPKKLFQQIAYHSLNWPTCSCVFDHVTRFIVNGNHSII